MAETQVVLIVLNGASSSGKTSIARELAGLLGPHSVCTGLDDILERVQPFGPERGSFVSQVMRSLRVLWFNATDGRLKLFKMLHREIVGLCRSGRAVIVEMSLMDARALYDAAEQFAPLDGFFVGVKPPLSVSEQWEAQRGDRPRGQARKHYELAHAHGTYDLLIDPSQMTPRECALAILQGYRDRPHRAFQQLLSVSQAVPV